MASVRARKVWRDLRADRGRVAILVLGIAVAVFGLTTILGARAILTREIARNYQATRPPTAVIDLDRADAALVDAVRARPGVAAVTARATVRARIGVDGAWRPLILFVAPGDRVPDVGQVLPGDHAWPPPDGTLFIERSAAALLGVAPGTSVEVRVPGGAPHAVAISGVVHDPALAPAAMERTGWAYATPATLRALGGGELDELWVRFAPAPIDQASADAQARALGAWLTERGHPPHEVRVTPLDRHPHESQMRAILLLLLTFSGLALVLAGVLTATLIAALLARQVRELGIMKTLGARPTQLAATYLGVIVVLGAIAVAVAVPLGLVAARAFAERIALLLNLELASRAVPWAVLAIPLAAGLLVPTALAAIPIARAARAPVRAAIDHSGARAPGRLGAALARVRIGGAISRMAMRNAFRRRGRLALTLAMLATGGALFTAALDLAAAWTAQTAEVGQTRHYGVELGLARPAAATALTAARAVPGVTTVEGWVASPASLVRGDGPEVGRTYPDGGHGSLRLLGAPVPTSLVDFPLLAGRWLRPDDTDGVVINHMLLAQDPALAVGGELRLWVGGAMSRWRVVGVVRDLGSAATVYARDAAAAQALGRPDRIDLLRASGDASPATIAALEGAVTAAGHDVASVVPRAELETAIGDHMQVLIGTLIAMAALLGLVGALGLAAAMTTAVLERTRELGVLRALGAGPASTRRLIATEAVVVAALAWAVGTALAVPLSALIGDVVGALAFRAPLPLVVRLDAVVAWLVGAVIIGVIAALAPARRAARLSIRDALTAV